LILDRDDRQDLGIERWKNARGRGTCLYPTGFGKTRVAMKVITRILVQKPAYRAIVIVPTDNLREQWTRELIERELIQNVDVYVVNTAIKRDLACELLIVDEVHMMVADTFKQIFSNIVYKMIMCLTGTIDRLDGKQEMLTQYAPIIDTISLDEAIESEWVADYKQYKVFIDVDLTEYKTWHTKFLHYFSYFGFDFDAAMKCATDFAYRIGWAKRHGMEVKDVMLQGLGFLRSMKARKAFVYDHPKKIEIANQIINARTDKKIITFTKTVEHAKLICCGDIYHGKVTKKRKEKMLQTFNDEEAGVLNSCKALDVGADVTGVNTAIIISGDSSSITKRQRIGRSIRKEGDKIAEVWQLVIRGTVEEEWYRKSSGGLKSITFDEKQLTEFLDTGTYKDKVHKEKTFLFRF
jgi:superfamily II DNA or RNA helicase